MSSEMKELASEQLRKLNEYLNGNNPYNGNSHNDEDNGSGYDNDTS